MAKTLVNFYRPHKRVSFDGSHPDTGEFLPSMTKQSFKAECDINNIIKQFSATGMLNHVNQRAAAGMYVDLPEGLELQEALNTVAAAEAAFMSLPSKIRDRFGNDPAQFLDFINDPKNEAEARALGLLKPSATPPGAPSAPGAPIVEAKPGASSPDSNTPPENKENK